MEMLALATLEARRRGMDPALILRQAMNQRAEMHQYRPRGNLVALFEAKESEVLVCGPAGTGKSRAVLERIVSLLRQYPRSRALIVRKTRESLTESGLVTLEDKVLGPTHPAVVNGPQRRNRQHYTLEGGSEIVVGGMDKPGKIMSTEYDFIYPQEAIEFTENDLESLTTRLRNGRMPFQQLVADTNPDKPTHWLKLRCDAGKMRLIESRHEDNPVLWDAASRAWTKRGIDYIAKLDALSGARKLRLRYGRWAQSEGVVYPEYDSVIHLKDRFEIPREWLRFRAVDFGYTNPFVCAWWAIDPDGRMYRYREIYRTKRTVKVHAGEIKRLEAHVERGRWEEMSEAEREEAWAQSDERVSETVCDHDAEDRATLSENGIGTNAAHKEVSRGLEAVRERLKCAGDGKPRIFFLRDSLVETDPDLAEAKKPLCTEQEFDGYVWSKATGDKGEAPVKADDHGMDMTRYAVMFADRYLGSIF
jgi:phage terminase large subunit